MKNCKLFISAVLAAMSFSTANAQVKDVTITVSPLVGYQWWNKSVNLENNLFYGVRAGFGFGQFMEIRAVAEKSLDLKGKIKSSDLGLDKELIDKLPSQTVDISRVGGEIKLNLLGGSLFSPYVLGGAGIQYFNYDPIAEGVSAAKQKERQIYTTYGAGIKLAFTNRAVFALEAKNVLFNANASNKYFAPKAAAEKSKLDNWSVLASLDFYLGGTEYDTNGFSLVRKMRDVYTSGFAHGVKFVVEPGFAFVDFKDTKRFKDQWFVGGQAGIDFSQLVGLRAFYYQATKDPNKLNLKFNDNLSMYGLNLIGRLSKTRGIAPYINAGAGYLNTTKGFDKDFDSYKKNNFFAQFGGGIDIPLSRWIVLYGSANAMLMANPDTKLTDVSTPSQVQTNMMYTGGVRINLGVPTRDPSSIYEREVNDVREDYNDEINKMRKSYEKDIERLNKQLDKALKDNDRKKVNELMIEKEELTKEAKAKEVKGKDADMMTKEEFEEMVDRVAKKINKKNAKESVDVEEVEVESNAVQSNEEVVKELKKLNKKLDRNFQQVNANVAATRSYVPVQGNAIEAAPIIQNQPVQTAPAVGSFTNNAPVVIDPQTNREVKPWKSLAVITGPSFGESMTWNVGVRPYFAIPSTKLDFVPELYIGMGSKYAFGLSGNVFYNFTFQKGQFVNPYVGLGLGLFSHSHGLHFGPNIIVGTSLDILGGKLFVDYSTRNLFQNNQVAVGYRFLF